MAFVALCDLTPTCRVTFISFCLPQGVLTTVPLPGLCLAMPSSLLGVDQCCGLASHSPKPAPFPSLSWESIFSHIAMIHIWPSAASSGLRTPCPYASLHAQVRRLPVGLSECQ